MNIFIVMATGLALAFAASGRAAEQDLGRPTAILVTPIHDAQVVRGDDGKDHVEYELLVVSVVSEPVTLTSVEVLDPSGKELQKIDGAALIAATQSLFDKKPSAVVAASAAVSVDVDLIVPPVPRRVRSPTGSTYTFATDSKISACTAVRPDGSTGRRSRSTDARPGTQAAG